MSQREVDVAVVGGGIVGLATTDALDRRGADVRCFEVGTPGHAQSGGLTRIFRHRHDDEQLVALAVQAREGWRRWEQRCGRRLLGSEGAVFAGVVHADAERLARQGVPHRYVRREQLPDVFGLAAPTGGPVLLDEEAGAIRARRTVDALHSWVGERIERAEVLGVTWPDGGAGVQLQTDHALYRARHVLVCAGAGTAGLAAGMGLAVPVRASLQARPTFRMRDAFAHSPATCWVDRSGEHGEQVYGSPVGTSGRYAVGLTGDDDHVALPAHGQVPVGTDMTEHVRRVAEYVQRALPGLDPEPESVKLCVSTHIADRPDIFGAWQAEGATAFAGQNLFKFAPVLGELLADVATKGEVADVLAPTAAG